MNQSKTSYQAYYKMNVQTADQLNLIIMMYDGLLRFMKKSVVKMNEKDIEGAHNYLLRSKDILHELLNTLRLEQGGEIAQNLKELYIYSFNKLVEANLTKNPDLVQEVIHLMNNLRQGWVQMRDKQNQERLRQKKDQSNPGVKIRVQG